MCLNLECGIYLCATMLDVVQKQNYIQLEMQKVQLSKTKKGESCKKKKKGEPNRPTTKPNRESKMPKCTIK